MCSLRACVRKAQARDTRIPCVLAQYQAQLEREAATVASRGSFAMFDQWTARPCCCTTSRHVTAPQTAQLWDLRDLNCEVLWSQPRA